MTNAEAVLQPYCEDNMKLLKRISKSIFMRFSESLSEADYDDFYSIANLTLWQAVNTYREGTDVTFDLFLRSCLKKKFATEIRDRHRGKRVLNYLSESLDAENEENKENKKYRLIDMIPDNFDTFEEVLRRQEKEQTSYKVQQYISKLSCRQKRILKLLTDGYKPKEVQKLLKITSAEYKNAMRIMRSFENVKILL